MTPKPRPRGPEPIDTRQPAAPRQGTALETPSKGRQVSALPQGTSSAIAPSDFQPIEAPLPRVSPEELAAWRETMAGGPFGEAEIMLITDAGGYEAILADPKKQADLQDVLDSLVGDRIINFRNAMRSLGWHPALSDQGMHPTLYKGALSLHIDSVAVIDHNFNHAGYCVFIKRKGVRGPLVSAQDLFNQPAYSFAAQIDQEATQHRNLTDVEADLEYARERKSRHEMVASSHHFAESMAHSDRISNLERELSRMRAMEPHPITAGSIDLVDCLSAHGFRNAAKSVREADAIRSSNVRSVTVALHNAAGILNRQVGFEDIFESTTSARIATERALTKGVARTHSLHLAAAQAQAKAAVIAGARGHHQMEALHQRLADWHIKAGLRTWEEIRKASAWVEFGEGVQVFILDGKLLDAYGRVQDTRHALNAPQTPDAPWETTDGKRHGTLTAAKLHEVKTESKPRLIQDGLMLPNAVTAQGPSDPFRDGGLR